MRMIDLADELPEEDTTADVAIGEIDAGETVTGEEGELQLDTDTVPSDEEIKADAALLERDESIQEPESEEIVQEEINRSLVSWKKPGKSRLQILAGQPENALKPFPAVLHTHGKGMLQFSDSLDPGPFTFSKKEIGLPQPLRAMRHIK